MCAFSVEKTRDIVQRSFIHDAAGDFNCSLPSLRALLYTLVREENSLCQSNKPLLCKNYQSVFINVCHCLLFFQYYKLTELQRNGCKLTHVVLAAIGVFVLDVWILLKFDNLIICNAYFHFKP